MNKIAQSFMDELEKDSFKVPVSNIVNWFRTTSPIVKPITRVMGKTRQFASKLPKGHFGREVAAAIDKPVHRVLNADRRVSRKLGLIPNPKPKIKVTEDIMSMDDFMKTRT